MLTEPDMQARYVAAALGVIEIELRKIGTSTANQRVLSALAASTSRVAASLAEELERRAGATARMANPPAAPQRRDNVLAFRTR